MTQTLLLDRNTWDLCVDAEGNIAVASEPYATAQDVASAIRTYKGECFYDTTLGLPYQTQILGQAPTASFLRAQFVAAALTVPDVVTAKAFLRRLQNRQLGGQVQIVDTTGNVSVASLGGGGPFTLDRSRLDGPDVLT